MTLTPCPPRPKAQRHPRMQHHGQVPEGSAANALPRKVETLHRAGGAALSGSAHPDDRHGMRTKEMRNTRRRALFQGKEAREVVRSRNPGGWSDQTFGSYSESAVHFGTMSHQIPSTHTEQGVSHPKR